MRLSINRFLNIIGHAVKFLGADNKIDMRQIFQERRPASLCHAAEEPEDDVRLFASNLGHHAHFSDRFLVGHIAHAAGVEQNDVGLRLVVRLLVASLDQRMRDLLRVALIHLAAIGFDEEFRHQRPEIIHGATGSARGRQATMLVILKRADAERSPDGARIMRLRTM